MRAAFSMSRAAQAITRRGPPRSLLTSRLLPPSAAPLRFNLKSVVSSLGAPPLAVGALSPMQQIRFQHSTTGSAGTAAAASSGLTSAPASDILGRLASLEMKIDADRKSAEEAKRALEDLLKSEVANGLRVAKVAESAFTMGSLFLIYLFFINTWMLLLLTDLSGHMHGIPVVRMVSLKPRRDESGSKVGLSVEPDAAEITDANTGAPEPHLPIR